MLFVLPAQMAQLPVAQAGVETEAAGHFLDRGPPTDCCEQGVQLVRTERVGHIRGLVERFAGGHGDLGRGGDPGFLAHRVAPTLGGQLQGSL